MGLNPTESSIQTSCPREDLCQGRILKLAKLVDKTALLRKKMMRFMELGVGLECVEMEVLQWQREEQNALNLVPEKKEKPTVGEKKIRSRFFLWANKKQKGEKGKKKG